MTELTTAILTILLGIIFIISFKRDKRNLLNAFLFLALLGMIYILVVQIAYQRHPRIHEVLLTFLYFVVPLIVFLVGLYLMINGFIVLKKKENH